MNSQNLKDRFSKTILCLIIICSLSLPLLQSKRQVYWLSKFLHLTCSGDIDTTWLKNLRPGNEAHYQIKRQLLIKLVSKHTSFLNLVRSSKNIVGFTSWYGLLFVFLETIIFHNIHSIYTLRYLCVSCLLFLQYQLFLPVLTFNLWRHLYKHLLVICYAIIFPLSYSLASIIFWKGNYHSTTTARGRSCLIWNIAIYNPGH